MNFKKSKQPWYQLLCALFFLGVIYLNKHTGYGWFAEGNLQIQILVLIRFLFFIVMAITAASLLDLSMPKQTIRCTSIFWNWCPLVICGIFSILLVFFPVTYNSLCLEDNLIENATAALFFLSSIVCFRIYHKETVRPQRFFFGATALAFFICAGEEVSWLQRYFEFRNPRLFESNLQQEFNFHNFATNVFEASFYFIFCAIIPLLLSSAIVRRRLSAHFLHLYPLPNSYYAAVSSAAFVNYDMLPGGLTQLSLAIMLVIILQHAFCEQSVIRWAVLLVCVTQQAIYMLFGRNLIRSWDATEFKEFLISFSILVLVRHVFESLRQTETTKTLVGSASVT